mgnify:CR=1
MNQIPIDERRSWSRVKKFETLCTNELWQGHEVGSHGRADFDAERLDERATADLVDAISC